MQKWDDELCPKKEDYPIFFATMQKQSKDNSGDKIYVKDPVTGENPKKGFNQTVTGKIKDACLRLDTALRLRFEYNYRYPHEVDPLAASNSYAIIYQVPFNGFGRLDRENIYATRRGEYAPLIATRAVEWFADYVYALRNALFHEIISPLDEEWQAIFKSAYLLLKQVSDICISCISQIDDFPQTQENAVFEYAEKHKAECFDQLADYSSAVNFP